jgi:putative nucleotidyltransferase with HDIG domain
MFGAISRTGALSRLDELEVRPRLLDDIETRSQLYVVTMWIFAAALVVVLRTANYPLGNYYVVLLLALVAAVAERGRVELNSHLSESISLVPILFAAVLFGPLSAMVVALASILPEIRPPHLRWMSYAASRSVTGATTGVVAVTVASAFENQPLGLGVATVIGALISQSLDAGFAATTLRLRRRAGLAETLRQLGPLALAAIPLYAPIVAFLAYAYSNISVFTLPLFFVPALAAQRLFVLYQNQRQLTGELVDANATLERANLSFASALVAALDARDRYTAGHSAAVAIYARDIAQRMDLPAHQQRLVHVCGLVHDIGKIGLPPGLLEKAGPLTLAERQEMQLHSEIGERILANVETYSEISSIVRSHHERIDGNGYPDGLSGDEIPLLSRIIAVADAYNAMTSDRPYRDAMPSRVARMRLAQAVETQFDTAAVAAFEAILANAPESYRLAQFNRGGFNDQWAAESPELRGVSLSLVSA